MSIKNNHKLSTVSLSRVIELFKESHSVIIATHEGPDADGIASALALGKALNSLGKEVKIYNPDPLPKNLGFLPNAAVITSQLHFEEIFDLAILIDVGEPKRVGKTFEKLKKVKNWLCLDHHAKGLYPLKHNFLEPDAASCGVILYHLFEALAVFIDAEMATLIYASLSADTGSFKYSNVNEEALEIAAKMVGFGAPVWEIALHLWESASLEKVKLLACVLPSLELTCENKVASLVILKEDFEKTNASEDLTEGFINIPRSIDTVEVAICFRQIEDHRFKISLRSKDYIDVAAIAKKFEGGGHARAAGCKVAGDLQAVKKQVYQAVLENIS